MIFLNTWSEQYKKVWKYFFVEGMDNVTVTDEFSPPLFQKIMFQF